MEVVVKSDIDAICSPSLARLRKGARYLKLTGYKKMTRTNCWESSLSTGKVTAMKAGRPELVVSLLSSEWKENQLHDYYFSKSMCHCVWIVLYQKENETRPVFLQNDRDLDFHLEHAIAPETTSTRF